MPKLFLHLGTHKTGTTTVQKAMSDNRDILARAGVYWPKTGVPNHKTQWGHHDLAYALRRPETAGLWTELRKECDTAGLENVFVSSEEFYNLPTPHMPGIAPFKHIAQAFAGYQIHPVIYLRPQADLLESLYNHNVKSVGETDDLFAFASRASARLNYAHYLNILGVALGDDAVIVRRFQPQHLAGGEILGDIRQVIGLPLDLSLKVQRPALNPGLTRDGFDAMLKANRAYKDRPQRLDLIRKTIVASHMAPPFYQHQILSEDLRAMICALYAQGNLMIARRFLKQDAPLFSDAPRADI
jgi:hypothetical protein